MDIVAVKLAVPSTAGPRGSSVPVTVAQACRMQDAREIEAPAFAIQKKMDAHRAKLAKEAEAAASTEGEVAPEGSE